jgi:hypothetical protein
MITDFAMRLTRVGQPKQLAGIDARHDSEIAFRQAGAFEEQQKLTQRLDRRRQEEDAGIAVDDRARRS